MLALETADTTNPTVWRQHLAELQGYARDWFVLMYSPYWERFIGFYRGHCDSGIILQAADPEAMRILMNRVAPPGWRNDAIRSIGSARQVVPIDPRELLDAIAPPGAAGLRRDEVARAVE
ncbi:hypothetical protein ACWEJ6_53205 [Nonomuraea sp. NPDC004702]